MDDEVVGHCVVLSFSGFPTSLYSPPTPPHNPGYPAPYTTRLVAHTLRCSDAKEAQSAEGVLSVLICRGVGTGGQKGELLRWQAYNWPLPIRLNLGGRANGRHC